MGIDVIIDGQFGSTGKGLLAEWLYFNSNGTYDIVASNASPNAGHTFWNGFAFCVTKQLPVCGILDETSLIYLTAGSVIDPDVLDTEIRLFCVRGRVVIHPHAAIVHLRHKNKENEFDSSVARIASTMQGTGEAIADRVLRKYGAVAKDHESKLQEMGAEVRAIDLNQKMRDEYRILMEVPQGFGLGLYSGAYPHCTSREISVSQALADAQVHPGHLGQVFMCIRTFPIRVGHLVTDDGYMIGHSGPFYNDSVELEWSHFEGVAPEKTTVTNRVRRIATFSQDQFRTSLSFLRPDVVLLNFVNYCRDEHEFNRIMNLIYEAMNETDIYPAMLYSMGPKAENITSDKMIAMNAIKERTT